MTFIPIVIGALDTGHQRFVTEKAILGNKTTRGDHPNYSIIGISQNTEESSGDLRRLAITQIPMENLQLLLV